MKKLMKIISTLFLFCCLVSLPVACGVTCGGPPIGLGEAAEKEIIDAFVAAHSQGSHPLTEAEISLRFYGAFDDVYVVLVDTSDAYILPFEKEVIADVEFIYEKGQELTVYTNGAFYSLPDAYKNNILSLQDLKAVQRNYKSDHQHLY